MALTVSPDDVSAAAGQLDRLGEDLRSAVGSAKAAVIGVAPPGADEISMQISALFNAHGQQWQQLTAAADAFHRQFAATLHGTATTYAAAESANATSVANEPLALIMEGTGMTYPNPSYLAQIGSVFAPGHIIQALPTPEQLAPLFGRMTYDQSVATGLHDLQGALSGPLASGRHVEVFGYSQSATIATEEIRHLMSVGAPYTKQLSFVLAGDPNNPNGGLAERFTGIHIPGLNLSFNGATPPNSPYPTTIITNQYDGIADFPQYPINLVSDANALAGVAFGAHNYADLPSLAGALTLPTSPGYAGHTQYLMELTQNLPLVEPLRWLQAPYGGALADLLQPDLRVLADMGYGTGYANVPTTAGLLAVPNPSVVGPDLANGVVQGLEAAGVDLGLLPPADYPMGLYPFSPTLNPNLNY